jgi:hypothetical protein
VCSCKINRFNFLQVTRNMVLFLLFNHTHMSMVEGSSFMSCTSPTAAPLCLTRVKFPGTVLVL